MNKFKELFEAKVNFADKGDVLVVKIGKPSSFYVVKKKDLEKDILPTMVKDVKTLKTGETIDFYSDVVYIGM